ncbi:hypothetical protein R1sor_024517 [Riccia sorocarpa]|uniref:Reverse transcriptase domain-containing protein n=1 Tax=Riccia sorocarpa TaxID=122646 RepID=A0ABD3GSA0_9MARC
MAIQELKARGSTLERRLQSILPDGKNIVDHSRTGRGRVGLLLHSNFKVVSEGVSGSGYAAWVKVKIGDKEIVIVTVHAPNKWKPRIRAWKWIEVLTRTGNWVIMVDLNQVDLRDDSVGPSPLIHGKDEIIWKNMVLAKDYVDCYLASATRTGLRFTRQAKCGNIRDRSRLDRVNISDGGQWLKHIHSTRHFGGVTTTDHIPVLVNLKGEAPTKFFFALAKARYARESINALEDAQGELKEKHNDIMEVVHSHYSQLYDAPKESSEGRWARRELLQLIDRGITEEHAGALDKIPEDEEIISLVKTLKSGKAPGLDGVTAEFIHGCWEFIQKDCCEMVHRVWRSRSMLDRDVRGCIKLLPKSDVKQKISNWHGARFPVRRIFFVKLDFSKAFDRVSFKYMWGVLQKMGISEMTIPRIRALMVGGASSVHVNQDFTRLVKIKHGVRQGCPLASLLFSLSSQPLMRAFQLEEEQGSLKGLRLPGLKAITHELFADDTSLFISASTRDFTKAKRVIERFELASGAALNMQKSLVMALERNDTPQWVSSTGCEIADRRTRFKFLGVWSGGGVTAKEVTEVMLTSIEKKLKLWANMYLIWKSRLLLKHICAVIPQHVLMSIGVDSKGSQKIEGLLGNFLWGWSREMKPMTALIAWDKLHFSKEVGGLGWGPMEVKTKALLAGKMLRIFQGEEVGWVRLTQAILKKVIDSRRELNAWSVKEVLVLGPKVRIRDAPTLTRLLQAWFKVREYLRWR